MSSHVVFLSDSNLVLLGNYERELLSVLTGLTVAESVPLPLARQLLEQAKQGADALAMPVLQGTALALVRQLESELPPATAVDAPLPH